MLGNLADLSSVATPLDRLWEVFLQRWQASMGTPVQPYLARADAGAPYVLSMTDSRWVSGAGPPGYLGDEGFDVLTSPVGKCGFETTSSFLRDGSMRPQMESGRGIW